MLNLWNPDSGDQVESDQRPFLSVLIRKTSIIFHAAKEECAVICKYIDTGEEDEQILGKLPTAEEIDLRLARVKPTNQKYNYPTRRPCAAKSLVGLSL